MKTSELQISVYAINLKKRPDRLKHIENEFFNKPEFDLKVIEAVEHTIGDIGLWKSLVKCVNLAKQNGDDVFILCEDDHQFTENYNARFLFENLITAHGKGADLLIGGSTGGFNLTVPVTENLIWVNHYCSNQFLIIFSKFYNSIITHTEFDFKKKVDNTLAGLALNKFIIYPYISTQRLFYYSDVTKYNDIYPENITERFEQAEKKLALVSSVYKHYKITESLCSK